MKTIKYAIILTVAPLFMIGCAESGGISSAGMGQDTTAINGRRGNPTSVISKGQADQYKRQQDVVSSEIDLDNKKHDASNKNINDTVNTVRNVAGTISGILRGF